MTAEGVLGQREVDAEGGRDVRMRVVHVDERHLRSRHATDQPGDAAPDHAGAYDRDPVADQRPGVPQGVDRGLHRAGEDGTLRRDVVGDHCHGVGRHDVRRLVGEETEDGAPPELVGTAVDDADVEVAVLDRAGKVTLLKRCPHHFVLALRDSATEHQSLGAAAHPGPQRAHQHLAGTRLRQLDRANLAPAGFADPERARFRRHPHPPLPDRMNRSVAFTV